MGEAVFISICVPAYSRVNYLKRLLASILQQSYRPFEVVITDDSPCNEVQALIGFLSLTPLIRYSINDTSMGPHAN